MCRLCNFFRTVSKRPPIEERFPRPSVMGVVNVTPDSFSDGGVNLDPDVAAAAARRMRDEGAAIVDVGGESTRPGSTGVTAEEELRRVVPVLERLRGDVPVSIDTAKAEVARRARERGRAVTTTVELAGLEIFGYHGVNEDERRDGQRFLYDVWLDVGDAGASDRIEDAVDYRQVAACVREVSEASRYHLLEALAGAVADALLGRFPVAAVRVRVRKPDVRLPVEFAAVSVERSR